MSDLEKDIKEHLKGKIKSSDSYAQNLYAALCNNRFIKQEEWSCSWRYAGGIISDIIDGTTNGNGYLNWYCSGTFDIEGYLPEGMISEEIEKDLTELGWKSIDKKELLV